jgi:hypothetical protein
MRLRNVRRLSDVPSVPTDPHLHCRLRRIDDLQRGLLRFHYWPVHAWHGQHDVRRKRHVLELYGQIYRKRVSIKRRVRVQWPCRLPDRHRLQHWHSPMHAQLRGWLGLLRDVLRRGELSARHH